ncbi:hypothetical protein V2J09_017605 [Rumex salicifolius]
MGDNENGDNQNQNNIIPASGASPLSPSDPLWVHHSEPSNYVLSTQLLNDRNYYKWKRAAEVSLKSKNKMAFVTGSVKRPAASDPLFSQWERANSLVTSWIFHSVEKDIAETLLFYDTAHEIWEDLKLRFGAPNCSRIFQVQKELFNVSQGNLSVSSCYTSFKRLWDEYFVLVDLPKCSSCGVVGAMPQLLINLQNVQFLVGLNDSYNSVRTNVLMMKPVPTLAEVYQLVLQDESQRELRSTPSVASDSTALHSFNKFQNSSSKSSGSSYSGGRGSSPQSQGGRGGGRGDRRSNFFCDHCKMQGHTIDRCYKLHGYPSQKPDSKPQSRSSSFSAEASGSQSDTDSAHTLTKEQYNQLLALLGKTDLTEHSPKSSLMAGSVTNLMSKDKWGRCASWF